MDNEPTNPGGPRGNNGWGNGDQDAPGNSLDNNNAENSDADNPLNRDRGSPENHRDNGFGNGDDDAPGNSLNNNNAENAGGRDALPSEYPGNSNSNGNQDVLNPLDLLDDSSGQIIPRGADFGHAALLFDLQLQQHRDTGSVD